ncbi:hypothetical protein [Alsobacter sp. SYSU BS001988]
MRNFSLGKFLNDNVHELDAVKTSRDAEPFLRRFLAQAARDLAETLFLSLSLDLDRMKMFASDITNPATQRLLEGADRLLEQLEIPADLRADLQAFQLKVFQDELIRLADESVVSETSIQ